MNTDRIMEQLARHDGGDTWRRDTLLYNTLFSREENFAKSEFEIFSREDIFANILFTRKFLPAKISSRENIFQRKYPPSKIFSCDFFSAANMWASRPRLCGISVIP